MVALPPADAPRRAGGPSRPRPGAWRLAPALVACALIAAGCSGGGGGGGGGGDGGGGGSSGGGSSGGTTGPAADLPPAEVPGREAYSLVFHDDFDDAARLAANWTTQTGSLEGNKELEWYGPGGVSLVKDEVGGETVSAVQLALRKRTPAGASTYPIATLCPLYPPTSYPQYYPDGAATSCTASGRTSVPYQFESGALLSKGRFAFRYGYLEVRARLSRGFALWPAIWMRDGYSGADYHEIDLMEGFNPFAQTIRASYFDTLANLYSVMDKALAPPGGDVGLLADGTLCREYSTKPGTTCGAAVDLSAGYHVYGLVWTSTGYAFYLDHHLVFRSASAEDTICHHYGYVRLDLAFGNNAWEFDWKARGLDPLGVDLADAALFPKKTLEVDYVKVWQPAVDVCTAASCP